MDLSRSLRGALGTLLAAAIVIALGSAAATAQPHHAGVDHARKAAKPDNQRSAKHRHHRRRRKRHHNAPGAIAQGVDEATALPATVGGAVDQGHEPAQADKPPHASSSGSTPKAGYPGTTSEAPANPTAPAEPEPPSAPAPPPTETVSTAHCFASPQACGYPDPTNTGVPAGVPLTPSGSITVTKAGTVISGLEVSGTINIAAANVTIENTRVTQNTTCGATNACGNYAIRIAQGFPGIVIRNVETRTVAGDSCQQDIRNTGSEVTIEGAYLHACDGNVYAVGPTLLKDSYGIAKIDISSDHIENVYLNETTFTALHDSLFNPVNQTAVIFGNSGGGTDVTNCSNIITITNSLLAGGGYSLYPCAHSSQPGSSSLNVEGNHFARCVSAETYEASGGHHPCAGGFDTSGYYPNSGSYGIAANFYGGTGIWRGNVWDDDLTKVCITGASTGCE
jgi:hypothetical protein